MTMKLEQYNKATVAALAGAIVTVFANYYPMDADMQGAVQTIIVTLLVWIVPNK